MIRAALFVLMLAPLTAFAQETAPAPQPGFQLPEHGDFLPLRRGTPAPHDGLLVDQHVMDQIQLDYDRMAYLLTRTHERDTEQCDVQVQVEHAHVTAAEERIVLHESLWTARQTELAAQVEAARAQAQRAAERAWYESPVIWFLVGVAATAAVWIATAVN